jgi:hypothetical protein
MGSNISNGVPAITEMHLLFLGLHSNTMVMLSANTTLDNKHTVNNELLYIWTTSSSKHYFKTQKTYYKLIVIDIM